MVSLTFLFLGLALVTLMVSGQTQTQYQVTTIISFPITGLLRSQREYRFGNESPWDPFPMQSSCYDHHKPMSDPFVMNKPGGGYQGIVIDILEAIKKGGNFSYTINLVKDGKWGSPTRNGSWNGMIGEILRNESHIAAAPLTILPQRASVVRLSQPFMDTGLRIVYKRPTDWMKNEPLFVILSVFSPGLWVVVFLAIAVVTVIFFLVARFSPLEDVSFGEKKQEEEGLTILNSLLYALSALGWQSCPAAPRSTSGRVLAAFWWMFSIFTLVAFTANLTAYFITQEPNVTRVPFTTFRELLRQRKITIGTINFGITEMFFKTTDSPLAKALYKRIDTKNFPRTLDEGIAKVRQGNYALIVDGAKATWAAGRKPCDLIVVGKALNEQGFSFACSNTSTVCDLLDHRILTLREQDVIYNITNTWMNEGCNADKSTELMYDGVPYFDTFGSKSSIFKDKAVTLKRFASGFILLFIGILLAGLCLVAEIVYARRSGYEVNVLQGMRKPDQERIQDSFDHGR